MPNPFDISAFNLLQFAEMVNNLYDDTPMTLNVPIKQPDGSIITKQIQNLGQFKRKVIDTTKGALKYDNVTFYVDAENGADTNDGLTNNTPLRTIKEAVDRVNEGGIGVIKLMNEGYTYLINETIAIQNKVILLYENVYGHKYNLQFNTYLATPSIKKIGQFRVEQGGTGFIKIHGCENLTLNDNYPDIDLVYTSANIFETTNAGAGANIIVALNVNNIYNNVKGAGIVGGYIGSMQLNLIENNFYFTEGSYLCRSDYRAFFLIPGYANFYDTAGNNLDIKSLIKGLLTDTNGNPKNLFTT